MMSYGQSLSCATECLIEAGEIIPDKTDDMPSPGLKQLLRIKAVHLLAVFLILYIGVEVTISGKKLLC